MSMRTHPGADTVSESLGREFNKLLGKYADSGLARRIARMVNAAYRKARRRVSFSFVTMMMKRCPDCTEMVRADARKCQFCSFRFDAPGVARWPLALAIAGALATIAGMFALAVAATVLGLAIGAPVFAVGLGAMIVQRRTRRRWSLSRSVPALGDVPMPPLVLLAGMTTMRGHARHAA